MVVHVFIEAKMEDGFGIADNEIVPFDGGADETGIGSGGLAQKGHGLAFNVFGIALVLDDDAGAMLKKDEGAIGFDVAGAELDESLVAAITCGRLGGLLWSEVTKKWVIQTARMGRQAVRIIPARAVKRSRFKFKIFAWWFMVG